MAGRHFTGRNPPHLNWAKCRDLPDRTLPVCVHSLSTANAGQPKFLSNLTAVVLVADFGCGQTPGQAQAYSRAPSANHCRRARPTSVTVSPATPPPNFRRLVGTKYAHPFVSGDMQAFRYTTVLVVKPFRRKLDRRWNMGWSDALETSELTTNSTMDRRCRFAACESPGITKFQEAGADEQLPRG